MIEEACRCADGFGVNHTHLGTYEDQPECRRFVWVDTGWVRVWVDWKQVAQELGKELSR